MEENASPQAVDIKDLRRRLGGGTEKTAITQAALAEKCAVHQATISRMEVEPALQKGPVAILLRTLDAETPEPLRVESAPAEQMARSA